MFLAWSGKKKLMEPVQLFFAWRHPSFFPMDGCFKPFGDELLSHPRNGADGHDGDFMNFFVAPIGAIGIGLEEDDGPFDFL